MGLRMAAFGRRCSAIKLVKKVCWVATLTRVALTDVFEPRTATGRQEDKLKPCCTSSQLAFLIAVYENNITKI